MIKEREGKVGHSVGALIHDARVQSPRLGNFRELDLSKGGWIGGSWHSVGNGTECIGNVNLDVVLVGEIVDGFSLSARIEPQSSLLLNAFLQTNKVSVSWTIWRSSDVLERLITDAGVEAFRRRRITGKGAFIEAHRRGGRAGKRA